MPATLALDVPSVLTKPWEADGVCLLWTVMSAGFPLLKGTRLASCFLRGDSLGTDSWQATPQTRPACRGHSLKLRTAFVVLVKMLGQI